MHTCRDVEVVEPFMDFLAEGVLSNEYGPPALGLVYHLAGTHPLLRELTTAGCVEPSWLHQTASQLPHWEAACLRLSAPAACTWEETNRMGPKFWFREHADCYVPELLVANEADAVPADAAPLLLFPFTRLLHLLAELVQSLAILRLHLRLGACAHPFLAMRELSFHRPLHLMPPLHRL